MALTLFEAAKQGNLNPQIVAVQMAIAERHQIQRFLPFIGTGDFQFDNFFSTESAVAQTRALNTNFTEGSTDLDKLQYTVSNLGDKARVDVKILEAKGRIQMAIQVQEKSFGIGAKFNNLFIKGDQGISPNDFNGLQTIIEKQLPPSQTITAVTAGAPTAGGDPLSLAQLDAAIDEVRDPNALLMSAAMARKFTAAGRDSAVAGFVTYTTDELGKRVALYNDMPIIVLKGSFNKDNILPFDEPAVTGGLLETSSLYIVKFGVDGLYGGQLGGGIDVTDFGRIPGDTAEEVMIEWSAGPGVAHPLSVARMKNIDDVAIVA